MDAKEESKKPLLGQPAGQSWALEGGGKKLASRVGITRTSWKWQPPLVYLESIDWATART